MELTNSRVACKCAQMQEVLLVNGTISEDFVTKVGVHQGSVLCPSLLIIALEALSHEFRSGCPQELLYDDDLVLMTSS